MKTRVVFIGLLVMVCLVVAGFALPAAPGSETGEVDVDPLTASGTIDTITVQLAHEFGGRIEEIYVREGDAVQRGQALVEIDRSTVAAQLAEVEAEVAAAQAELDISRAGPRSAEIDAARAQVAQAQANADGAYRQWQNALAMVENPQELNTQLAQANAQSRLAAQGVEKTRADLARLELESGTVSGEVDPTRRTVLDYQLVAAREAVAAAEADQRAADTLTGQLGAIVNNPLHLVAQANQAEGTYRLAAQAVAVAQAKLDDLLAGATPEEIAVAEARLAFVQAQADAYRAQLDTYTLTSPLDGVVIDRVLHPGEAAAAGASILTLADLSQLTLSVYVPASDLSRVVSGQAVDVTVDSFPGQTFRGVVRRIAAEAEYTPRNVSTRDERANLVFAVEVWLPNADRALKPGMPADAVFAAPRSALMVRLRPADLLNTAAPTATSTTPPATPSPMPTATPALALIVFPSPTPTRAAPCRASITASLNVRSGPGTGYDVIGRLQWPATVDALARADSPEGAWWRIDYNGARAWIAAWYTDTEGLCNALPVEAP